MFASFHSEGTIPSPSDKLKKIASGVLICSTISLSSFGGIPSTPGDLLSFIVLIFFAIISGVTNNCPKCSDLLPSNLVNGTGSALISSVVKTDCVGCADRSCYNLSQHTKSTGIRLVAEKKVPEPIPFLLNHSFPRLFDFW